MSHGQWKKSLHLSISLSSPLDAGTNRLRDVTLDSREGLRAFPHSPTADSLNGRRELYDPLACPAAVCLSLNSLQTPLR